MGPERHFRMKVPMLIFCTLIFYMSDICTYIYHSRQSCLAQNILAKTLKLTFFDLVTLTFDLLPYQNFIKVNFDTNFASVCQMVQP